MNAHWHILVIDDEDSVADMVAEALRDEEYTVSVAYDGRTGLERARQTRPDLILSDVMMPFIDGIQLAQALEREFGPDSALIVFMSAVDRRGDTEPYGEFLAKPFTLEALFDKVETLLGRYG